MILFIRALSNIFASAQSLYGVGAARGHYDAHSSSRAAGELGSTLTCAPLHPKSLPEPQQDAGGGYRLSPVTMVTSQPAAAPAIIKVSEWLPRKGCEQWVAPAESKTREVLATDLAKPIASLGAPREQGFARKPETWLLAPMCLASLDN